MINVNNETHPFIDLPNLELPITWQELFDEEDLEVVNGDCQLKKVVHTTNFEWMPNLSEHSPPSILGLIHSNKVSKMLWEWFQDNSHNNLLAPIRKSLTGKNYFPITMLKFHGTSLWHREGYPYWTDETFRKLLKGRNNYAFNFPFYGEVEKTSVKFGKGDPQLESMLEGLLREHVDTNIVCSCPLIATMFPSACIVTESFAATAWATSTSRTSRALISKSRAQVSNSTRC